MTMLYALIINVCLSNGECYAVAPEVFDDMTRCVMEAHYQRKTADNGAYCEEVLEEGEGYVASK